MEVLLLSRFFLVVSLLGHFVVKDPSCWATKIMYAHIHLWCLVECIDTFTYHSYRLLIVRQLDKTFGTFINDRLMLFFGQWHPTYIEAVVRQCPLIVILQCHQPRPFAWLNRSLALYEAFIIWACFTRERLYSFLPKMASAYNSRDEACLQLPLAPVALLCEALMANWPKISAESYISCVSRFDIWRCKSSIERVERLFICKTLLNTNMEIRNHFSKEIDNAYSP